MGADGALGSWLAGPFVAFAAGMLSFLSPCVLPLVPGYLSLMSGMSGAELAEAKSADLRRVLRSTLLFMAGFTVVFMVLWVGATGLSQTIVRHQVGINRVAGALVIFMGLFLAGVISPRLLMQERRFHVSPSRLGPWAPPVMGMAFAFGWTPCIGPVLGVVLGLAATRDTMLQGGILLLSYCLGLGVPFVVSGVAFGRMAGVFGWFKRHFRALNLISGTVLVVFGLLLFTGNVAHLARNASNLLRDVPLLNRLAQS
ncbi:MAG TPA: cytochrome c biogenesis protein CcdA [Acidimicrobiales bacterium]|nr:cytochrome c biogenesis protein CcdA [Acidimicrobiales bacterium]